MYKWERTLTLRLSTYIQPSPKRLMEETFRITDNIVLPIHIFISSRTALGPMQPPIRWAPGVMRQEREADHTLPTTAEVK
jgi:hypothetical protein